MPTLANIGRVLFAISMIFFGVQYFIFGQYAGGLPPVPPWAPGGIIGAYVTGSILVFCSLGLAARWQAPWCGTFLGFFFFLCVLLLHAQRLSDVIHNGNDRTRCFEVLALCGAAFMLAGDFPAAEASESFHAFIAEKLVPFGRWLFAISLVIFGAQHFMYGPFVGSLIPGWIPGHLFFAYFTGVGLIAAGIAIAAKVLVRLGATLLGIMFLFWTLFLHAPRIATKLHSGDEWTSGVIALAMCGAALYIAGTVTGGRMRTVT
jgi:uncharacterized membrane protein YphA (DoxX/SURF4 family)